MIGHFASGRSFKVQSLKIYHAFTHLHMVFSTQTVKPLWHTEIACYCKQLWDHHCNHRSSWSTHVSLPWWVFLGSWELTFLGDKTLSLKSYYLYDNGRTFDRCFLVWNIKGTSSVDGCHLWACLTHIFFQPWNVMNAEAYLEAEHGRRGMGGKMNKMLNSIP